MSVRNREALRSSQGYRPVVAALEGRLLMAAELLTVSASAQTTPVVVTSTVLNVTVSGSEFSQNAQPNDFTYRWSTVSAPSGVPAPILAPYIPYIPVIGGFPGSEQVTFGAAGDYTFKVDVTDAGGVSGSALVNVTVDQSALAVAVVPLQSTLADGQSEPFTAFAVDQFNRSIVAPTAVWTLLPGGVGTINPQTGVYTAPASGGGSATVVGQVANGRVGFSPVYIAATVPAFHVIFTENPSQTPAGYVSDTGQRLATTPSGLDYGWNRQNIVNAVDRNNPASPDELHDSYVAMQGRTDPNASWTIAVPNGVYRVHLIAGDPNSNNSIYRMNINGALALAGRPKGAQHWVESTVTVRVTNHRITVSNARGARNNKLDAIDIVSASPVAAPASKTPAGPRAIRARR